MQSAINAFLLGFPALFSIVNPISGALIFQQVTAGWQHHDRVRLARAVALNSWQALPPLETRTYNAPEMQTE